MKFIFTYGTEGHPFVGGWTEVEADTEGEAVGAFLLYHASANGCIPCCTIYEDGVFKKTPMFKNGNFGRFCHETISIQRSVISGETA